MTDYPMAPITYGQVDKWIEEAVLAEREACAKVCEDLGEANRDSFAQYDCAAAIRARGEK